MTTTNRLSLTVELVEPNEGTSGLLDTARHVRNEADRLRTVFAHATDDAPIRVTIANLDALANALSGASA